MDKAMKTGNLLVPMAGAALLMLATAPAQAALVSLCGSVICYEYDNDVNVNSGYAEYGDPQLLGNTLAFSPSDFKVDSDPNTPIVTPTLASTFYFTRIYTTDGGEIASIDIREDGNYYIEGNASVSTEMRIEVNDLLDDGLPSQAFPEQIIDIQPFFSNTPSPLGGPNSEWSLSSSVSPMLNFTDLATSVNLSIGNTLTANNLGDGYAFVAKNLLLTVVVEPGGSGTVPIPAAAWLFGSAFGVLTVLRRRAA